MRRPAVLLFVLLLSLTACTGDKPGPKPTPGVDTERAAAAFAQAYADFRADFAAATEQGDRDDLESATKSVRAVRTAYADLADATRRIDLPEGVTGDVDEMLDAIADLLLVLADQASATSSEEFQAAGPDSSDALQRADDAIEVVVDALGIGADDPGTGPEGPAEQPSLEPDYLDGANVTDARAWVDDLLDVGSDHADHQIPSEDMGIVIAWRAAFPQVLEGERIVGAERRAPKSGISGFAVLPADGQGAASRSNLYVLAFAARDASGGCAGGVLSGYPDPTERREVDLPRRARCSGVSVAAAAGY